MRLDLATWLSAPPDAVWPYVSDATKMSLWSLAPIRRLEPGDGDVPGATGELREVSILWPAPLGAALRVRKKAGVRATRLEEVIEHSEPPRRLVYRVVRVKGGMPVRGHRGEMRLEPERGGTRLTWDVSFEFGLPGVGAGIKRNQIAACDSGRVQHPAWVLRLVPRFHAYYVESLAAWRCDRGGESHWRAAFHGMERSEAAAASPFEAVVQCILRGARAHIDEDLPRALAEVHFEHYRARCTMARFRADYALMGDVFHDASESLMHELPPELVSRLGRALDLLPREAKDALTARQAIDLPRARRKAFERGERIAALLAKHAG